MDLFTFINSFSNGDYQYSKAVTRWNLDFNHFSRFNEEKTIECLNNLKGMDLLSYNGVKKSTSGEFDQIDIPTSDICKFTINIKLDKIKEYILGNNSLTDNDISVHFAFNENEYINFTYTSLAPDKLNVLLYPKAEFVLNNSFVIISNTTEVIFQLANSIREKHIFIKEASTILINNFYLPEIFYFDSVGFDKLPSSFRSGFIVSILLSICSHSRKEANKYYCGIKGYKTIAIELTENTDAVPFLPVNDLKLFQLNNWIFEEIKISDVRLGVIRYLLTLDVLDSDGILRKISDVNNLLLSAKHQFELVISGSIKEHFENLIKANERVKSAVDSIYEQIDKLSNSLNQVIIGGLGLIITFFGNFDQLSKTVKIGYSILLLVYLSYLRFHSTNNILGRKNQILLQFNAFAETLKNQLKIIDSNVVEEQIKQPLETANERFEKNYFIVKLIIEIAIMASLFGIFIWDIK